MVPTPSLPMALPRRVPPLDGSPLDTRPCYARGTSKLVLPIPSADVLPAPALCGQLALAYVCQMTLETVLRLARTDRAMTYAQLRSFAATFTEMRPTEVSGVQLRDNPRGVWHTYGGERFLAILPDVDVARPDVLGHVVVMDGRTIVDVDGPTRARRVNIDVLAAYPLALVFSAGSGR